MYSVMNIKSKYDTFINNSTQVRVLFFPSRIFVESNCYYSLYCSMYLHLYLLTVLLEYVKLQVFTDAILIMNLMLSATYLTVIML